MTEKEAIEYLKRRYWVVGWTIVKEKSMERQSRWRDAAMQYRRRLRKPLSGLICRRCAGRKLEVWEC